MTRECIIEAARARYPRQKYQDAIARKAFLKGALTALGHINVVDRVANTKAREIRNDMRITHHYYQEDAG